MKVLKVLRISYGDAASEIKLPWRRVRINLFGIYITNVPNWREVSKLQKMYSFSSVIWSAEDEISIDSPAALQVVFKR